MKAQAVITVFLILASVLMFSKCQSYPYITFSGTTMMNHSCVNFMFIERNRDHLQCHFDLRPCCYTTNQYQRNWFFPNGSELPFIWDENTQSHSLIFHKREHQHVDLGAQRVNILRPNVSGIFCCNISTVNGPWYSAYVGIYCDEVSIGGE